MPSSLRGPRAARVLACAALLLLPLPLVAQAPTVSFDPVPGAVAQTSTWVTIFWSDAEAGLSQHTRTITVGGVDRTSSFSYEVLAEGPNGEALEAQSQGLVTLSGNGAPVTVRARICNVAFACSPFTDATYRYLPPPQVLAAQSQVARPRNEQLLEIFRIVNPSASVTGTYALSGVCDAPVQVCLPSTDTVTVGPGDTAVVGVNYRVGNSGFMGSVGLSVVDNAGSSAFASTLVFAMASAGPPGNPGERQDLTLLERSMCVTVSVSPGAAYECGDLRLVHPLPTTRVLNRARTPVLIFNSQHARPTPVVAVHLVHPAGARPDSLFGRLLLDNVVVATKKWTGLPAADTLRVALAFDAVTRPTGVYGYTLEVTGYFPGGVSQLVHSRTGRLAVVNRDNSPFGRGWWLAGLEQLLPLNAEEKLWVGGDGSTRMYRLNAEETAWVGPFFDRPDTLKADPATPGGFFRTLPGGAKVFFDGAGQHVRTENTLGHATRFDYSGGRLTQIRLPLGSTSVSPEQVYAFSYTATNPILTEVIAPRSGVGADSARVVRLETSGRNVARIWDAQYRMDAPLGSPLDPSKPHVRFVPDAFNRVRERHDRMGVPTVFEYSAGGLMSDVKLVQAPGDTIRASYRGAETQGFTAAVKQSDVFTQINGPRPEVQDITKFYLDRWGAPYRVVDALGNATQLRRGSTQLPALVTWTRLANGRVVSATHDDRGNLLSISDSSTVATHGRYATTTYAYDRRWDQVTRLTLPEGETSATSYDAYGRPVWMQQGPDAARRVTFQYNPLQVHPTNAPGLLQSVTMPATSEGAAVNEVFEYDGRGNLSATLTPMGTRTVSRNDSIGRPVRVESPIENTLVRVTETTFHPATDRVASVVVTGPAITVTGGTIPQQQLVVRTAYDREGRTKRVSRRDAAIADSIVTRWTYDGAGRVRAERAPDTTPLDSLDNPRDSTVYDPAGNPTWTLTRRGDTIRTRYDELSRPMVRYASRVTYDSTSVGIPRRDGTPHCSTSMPPFEHVRHVYPFYPSPNTACGFVIERDSAMFAYDAMGNVTRADNADAQVRRGYYANGLLRADTLRIQTLERNNLLLHQYPLAYAYDLNGRRTTLTHPAQLAPTAADTRYAYQAGTGTLETVTDPLGNVFRYTHDARGQLDRVDLPAGVVQTYRHNQDGLLSHYGLNVPGVSSTLSNVTFTYDLGGKLRQSDDAGPGLERMFADYSGLGHLVRNSLTANAEALVGTTVHYTTSNMRYDALGNNVESENSTSTVPVDEGIPQGGIWGTSPRSAAYDPRTGRQTVALTADKQQGFTYDGGGNIHFSSEIPIPANVIDDNDRRSYFAADGTLRAVDQRSRTGLNGVRSVTWEDYRYDALGRRVWVRTRRWCNGTNDNARCSFSSVRRTVWDGDQVLYEIQAADAERENDGQPTPLARVGNFDPNPMLGRVLHTHGPGIDQPLSVIRMGFGDRPVGLAYAAWPTFGMLPLWDTKGRSPYMVFSHGGRLWCPPAFGGGRCLDTAWLIAWTAYGPRSNAAVISDEGREEVWLGGVMEDQQDASGLLYRRNRYYDPGTGRFTQEDPIGLAGGINLYGFAGGDPVSYSDPYGLCPEHLRVNGVCPGGLSVKQYNSIEFSAQEGLTGGARDRILHMLRNGDIVLVTETGNQEPTGAQVERGRILVTAQYFSSKRPAGGNGTGYHTSEERAWVLAHELGHLHQFQWRMLIQESGEGVKPSLGRIRKLLNAATSPTAPAQIDADRYACTVAVDPGAWQNKCPTR